MRDRCHHYGFARARLFSYGGWGRDARGLALWTAGRRHPPQLLRGMMIGYHPSHLAELGKNWMTPRRRVGRAEPPEHHDLVLENEMNYINARNMGISTPGSRCSRGRRRCVDRRARSGRRRRRHRSQALPARGPLQHQALPELPAARLRRTRTRIRGRATGSGRSSSARSCSRSASTPRAYFGGEGVPRQEGNRPAVARPCRSSASTAGRRGRVRLLPVPSDADGSQYGGWARAPRSSASGTGRSDRGQSEADHRDLQRLALRRSNHVHPTLTLGGCEIESRTEVRRIPGECEKSDVELAFPEVPSARASWSSARRGEGGLPRREGGLVLPPVPAGGRARRTVRPRSLRRGGALAEVGRRRLHRHRPARASPPRARSGSWGAALKAEDA
jgi:hypothetical protein